MHSNITDFVSDVSDSIKGNWSRVGVTIEKRYPKLNKTKLSEINGRLIALRSALIELYGLHADSIETIIRKMAHKADDFSTDTSSLRNIQHYWSELTPADLGQINSRRSNLVSLLASRYSLSRESAWEQVNNYFLHVETITANV